MKLFLRILFPLLYLAILILPAWVFFDMRGGTGFTHGLSSQDTATAIFPLFGLYAMTFVWFQVMLGSLMPVWENLFPKIFYFHRAEGVFALLFAFTHPTLRAIGIGLSGYFSHLTYGVLPGHEVWVYVGYIQLTIMLTTVGTALLMRVPAVAKFWRKWHVMNYSVFGLAWLHSWFLGSDIQTTNLKWLWIFFLITAIGAVTTKLTLRARRRMRLQTGPQA